MGVIQSIQQTLQAQVIQPMGPIQQIVQAQATQQIVQAQAIQHLTQAQVLIKPTTQILRVEVLILQTPLGTIH